MNGHNHNMENYVKERLDRMERFCMAHPTAISSSAKMLTKRSWPTANITFKKYPAETSIRDRSEALRRHPGRLPNQERMYGAVLLRAMKPCRVRIKRLNSRDIEKAIDMSKIKPRHLGTQDNVIIDLCSSDEEDPSAQVEAVFVSFPPNKAIEPSTSANVQQPLQPLARVVSKHIPVPVKVDTTPTPPTQRCTDKHNQENDLRMINGSSNLTFPKKVSETSFAKCGLIDLTM